jgi:hypothetical protein
MKRMAPNSSMQLPALRAAAELNVSQTKEPMTAVSELRRCVQALAQPASMQVSLFPDFAVVGDELALQFEGALVAYRSSAPAPLSTQAVALELLDGYLSQLSGPENSSFWDDPSALPSDARWQRVRDLAQAVLSAFDWPDEPPPRDGATYVGENGVVHNT